MVDVLIKGGSQVRETHTKRTPGRIKAEIKVMYKDCPQTTRCWTKETPSWSQKEAIVLSLLYLTQPIWTTWRNPGINLEHYQISSVWYIAGIVLGKEYQSQGGKHHLDAKADRVPWLQTMGREFICHPTTSWTSSQSPTYQFCETGTRSENPVVHRGWVLSQNYIPSV